MNQNFTEGKILTPLLKFAFPVLLASLIQTLYGAVDLLILGKFGTASDLSAVSTGDRMMQTVTAMVMGLSMGITILAGQKIGEGKPQDAGRTIGSGIWLFSVIGAVFTVFAVALTNPLAQLMQVPSEAFGETVRYVRICSAGTVFIVAYNVIGSIFRGIGDSRMPLFTVAVSCGLNVLGDLALVGGLHLGVTGAAMATVLAQCSSVLLSIVIIRRRSLPFTLSRQMVCFDRAYIGKILNLGMPVAFQNLLINISFLVLIAVINTLGLAASAGVGIAGKVTGFVMLVPSAFAQSMAAFVAQNVGAKTYDRARKALFYGIVTSLAVSMVMGWFAFFHGDILASWFYSGENEAVIFAAWDYLRAYAIDCLLTSFLFSITGYLNGFGKTIFVMAQGVFGAFCVRIPVSIVMSRLPGISLFWVGFATPASTAAQLLLCGLYFWRRHGKTYSQQRSENLQQQADIGKFL